MASARPRRNATPSKHFPHTARYNLHTPRRDSHFTLVLHIPHFMSSHLISCHLISSHLISFELFSPHLTSSQLFSSHPISSHMSSKYITSSQLFSSHPGTDQPFSSQNSSQPISAVLRARKLVLSDGSLSHTESFVTQKLETQMRLHIPLPHQRSTSHRWPQPLSREKRKVSCWGLLPNTSPMQESYGHFNAFCSMTWLTRMHLCTWQRNMATVMQPLRYDLEPGVQQAQRTMRA